MGRSGKTVRLCRSNEEKSGATLFKSRGSVCHRRAAGRSRGRLGDRAKICAPRYTADDCDEQIDGTPASRPEFSRPETPAQPATGNIETPRHEDVRAAVLNQFLHPQTQERASRCSGAPVLAFRVLAKWRSGRRELTRVGSAKVIGVLESQFHEDLDPYAEHAGRENIPSNDFGEVLAGNRCGIS